MPGVRCFVFLLVATAAVFPSVTNARRRRGKPAVRKPVVEVLVVFDDYSWHNWTTMATRSGNSLNEEIASMFFEAGKLLEDVDIELRIKQVLHEHSLIIPKDAIYNGTWVDTFYSLDLFQSYMKEKGEIIGDVALMIVGQDLATGASNDGGGVAYLSQACSYGYVGLIEATYDMRMAIAIAHEIAHLLSVRHDGQGNNCTGDDGYIMTASTDLRSGNSYFWSECSKKTFKNFLASPAAHCLYKTNSKPIKAERLGRLVAADETCVRYFGATSYVHRTKENVPMCLSLTCITDLDIEHDPVADTISYSLATNLRYTPAALPCGKGKSCFYGKCVADPKAPVDIKEDCLFGDAPLFIKAPWKNCLDVVDAGGCDFNFMTRFCCNACP